MFPVWPVEELFKTHTNNAATPNNSAPTTEQEPTQRVARRTADIEGVYRNRMDLARDLPPQEIFKGARTVDVAGISINVLCQHFSDTDLRRLLENGCAIRCLFLDPAGDNIRVREAEERHEYSTLSNLTELNIRVLQRVRHKTAPEVPGSIRIRTYDEPARYNLTIVDSALCIMQPYLPEGRGIESPAFVARKSAVPGIFDTYASVFDTMWSRGKEVERDR